MTGIAVWVSLALLLPAFAVGLRTAWSVERVLTRTLQETRAWLNTLDMAAVEDEAAHAEVQAVFDRVAVVCPPIAQAWVEFDETLVRVDGRPRSTRQARDFLSREPLRAWQRERKSWLLREPALMNFPSLLARLGGVGSAVALVAALMAFPAPEFLENWRAVLDGLRAMWPVPVPWAVGTLLGMMLRGQVLQGSAALDRALADLVLWVDMHYRTVVAEELLARILERLEKRST